MNATKQTTNDINVLEDCLILRQLECYLFGKSNCMRQTIDLQKELAKSIKKVDWRQIGSNNPTNGNNVLVFIDIREQEIITEVN